MLSSRLADSDIVQSSFCSSSPLTRTLTTEATNQLQILDGNVPLRTILKAVDKRTKKVSRGSASGTENLPVLEDYNREHTRTPQRSLSAV